MKTRIFQATAFALVCGLAGCGKGVPSCGDPQVTSLVTKVLSDGVEKNMPDIDAKLKSPVHLSVDQPVVVSHDEHTDSYSCKAVVTYQVPDTVQQMQVRGQADGEYKKTVQVHWRRLMGLFSVSDVQEMISGILFPQNSALAQVFLDDLKESVHASADASGPEILDSALAQAKQNSGALNEDAVALANSLDEASKNAGKVTFNTEYTVAKVDGQQQFRVDAKSDDGDTITGIRNIQVLDAATHYVNDALASDKAAAAAQAAASAKSTASAVNASVASPASAVSASDATRQAGVTNAVLPASETVAVAASAVQRVSEAASAPSPQAIEASFDCEKASSAIERLICSTPETADADRRLAAAYGAARAKSNDPDALKADQRDWIKNERNACSDAACLTNVTEARIQKLPTM